MAIVTKHGIRVVSYVHTERGLVDCDELTPEEKQRAATAIKLKYMSELYRGKAEFFPAPGGAGKTERRPGPEA